MSILSDLKQGRKDVSIFGTGFLVVTFERAIEWLEKMREFHFFESRSNANTNLHRLQCHVCKGLSPKDLPYNQPIYWQEILHAPDCKLIEMYEGLRYIGQERKEEEIRNHNDAIEFLRQQNEKLAERVAEQEKLIGVMRAQMMIAEVALKGNTK